MITQRPGKVTAKFVEGMDSDTLFNVLNHTPEYKGAAHFWRNYLEQSFWKPLEEERVRSWGTPNINMRSFESSPGVWIFDDLPIGITWYVWTDLHHKHPWKGTSFEIYVPENVSSLEMLEAVKRFADFVKIS